MPTEDYCPDTADHKHTPDWNTLTHEDDGGEVYLDVTCSACGRSGCVGTKSSLEEGISW